MFKRDYYWWRREEGGVFAQEINLALGDLGILLIIRRWGGGYLGDKSDKAGEI